MYFILLVYSCFPSSVFVVFNGIYYFLLLGTLKTVMFGI